MRTATNYPRLESSSPVARTARPITVPSGASHYAALGQLPQPATKTIRILVVDDHPVVRMGLRSCLSQFPQISVVGEAADGQEALRKAKELAPDLVLMDINMPRMNGLTAAAALRRECPNIKVLVLSAHRDPEYVARLLQSGARGFALKQAPTEELIEAIEKINAGEVFFSPAVASVALNQFVRGNGEASKPGAVSNREREVLIAVAEGLSNKEIACRLSVGVRTVETHRERIMRKLNIHTIAGLTKYAIAKKFISLPEDPEMAFSGSTLAY